MKKYWNDPRLQKRYIRELERAKNDPYGFTNEELESHYLDKLSKQTRSSRIMRMITLAYTLGQLRAISEADDGLTPITLS